MKSSWAGRPSTKVAPRWNERSPLKRRIGYMLEGRGDAGATGKEL